MILFLLLSVFCLTKILSLVCSKSCSNVLQKGGLLGHSIYIFLVSIISCVTYASFTGFTLKFDLMTFLLGMVLAVASTMSLLTSLVIYRLASVSGVNVISTSLSIVTSALIGFIVFGENVDTIKIIRIVIMVLAGIFVYFENVAKEDDQDKKRISNKLLFVLILLVQLIIGCYTTIQSKLLSGGNLVTDVNTFFFMTNVYMLLGSGIIILYFLFRKPQEVKQNLVLLKPKNLIAMTGNTFGSNVSVFLNVLILARMDLSVFTMISSAFGIICAAVVSVLFHEKLGVYAKIAIGLSLVVAII